MILVVDMNWKRDSLGFYEFVLPLVQIAQKRGDCVVRHYLEVDSRDLNDCSHIILSGTALKDNVSQRQPEKFGWLKNTSKPVLGVCAGMQAIGVAHGLSLKRYVEIGMTPVTTLQQNPLFSGSFSAYSLHNFCVEPTAEFEVLAESSQCMQAMRHRQKEVYGMLFHPEVRNAAMVERFLQL